MVVSKSSVHAVACGPIIDVASTMDRLDFGCNGCACLGTIYLAKLSENYPTEGIVVVEKQSVKYKLLSTRHYDENVT